jgi:hypothetical protein
LSCICIKELTQVLQSYRGILARWTTRRYQAVVYMIKSCNLRGFPEWTLRRMRCIPSRNPSIRPNTPVGIRRDRLNIVRNRRMAWHSPNLLAGLLLYMYYRGRRDNFSISSSVNGFPCLRIFTLFLVASSLSKGQVSYWRWYWLSNPQRHRNPPATITVAAWLLQLLQVMDNSPDTRIFRVGWCSLWSDLPCIPPYNSREIRNNVVSDSPRMYMYPLYPVWFVSRS